MSIALPQLLDSLVQGSPAGELGEVGADLQALAPGSRSAVNGAIENHINTTGVIVSGHIASQWNKVPNSSKYIDYTSGTAFNVDFARLTAIDEEKVATPPTPAYYASLVAKLEAYGADHYPSQFAFVAVPGDELHIVVIGQKLNKDNFYTGEWKSHYVVANGHIRGSVHLDIHYFEDGNVRLRFDEDVDRVQVAEDASAIVNFINTSENAITLKIVKEFTELNEKYFRNLRRLLPVTKSKVNWGKAIGNYRLGSDVISRK